MRTGLQRLQSNQLVTPMLSSRLIGRVSQWLCLLSPRLPGGAVLIISQPARLNPSPGALRSKWMKGPWTVFWLHNQTTQQRKRSEHTTVDGSCVHAHTHAHPHTGTHANRQTARMPFPHLIYSPFESLLSHSLQSEG